MMKLSLDLLVRTALELQNREGLDAVTTRRLAEQLKVTSPALYRHVPSKEALFGHMVAFILAEALAAMRPCDDWEDWLAEYARTFRNGLLAYRDSVRMMLVGLPSPRTSNELVPAVFEPLTGWGFSHAEAVAAEGVLASFVLGWVGYEQNPALRPILASMFDIDAQFERNTRMIVIGLRQELGLPEARRPERTA